MTITTTSFLLTADHCNTAAATVSAQATPSPPSDLTKKHRWMQCTVKNETQFPLVFLQNFNSSGRYWTAPASMTSFQQMVFSVCNGDGTTGTGASGGTSFGLLIDANNTFNVSLGWTNPSSGAIKAGVKESSRGEDGHEAAAAVGNTIDSRNTYTGPDTNGKTTTVRFHVATDPGQATTYVVTQVYIN